MDRNTIYQCRGLLAYLECADPNQVKLSVQNFEEKGPGIPLEPCLREICRHLPDVFQFLQQNSNKISFRKFFQYVNFKLIEAEETAKKYQDQDIRVDLGLELDDQLLAYLKPTEGVELENQDPDQNPRDISDENEDSETDLWLRVQDTNTTNSREYSQSSSSSSPLTSTSCTPQQNLVSSHSSSPSPLQEESWEPQPLHTSSPSPTSTSESVNNWYSNYQGPTPLADSYFPPPIPPPPLSWKEDPYRETISEGWEDSIPPDNKDSKEIFLAVPYYECGTTEEVSEFADTSITTAEDEDEDYDPTAPEPSFPTAEDSDDEYIDDKTQVPLVEIETTSSPLKKSEKKPLQRRVRSTHRACDFCWGRHKKCDGGKPCTPCHQRRQPCKYTRRKKKRGPKPKAVKPPSKFQTSRSKATEKRQNKRSRDYIEDFTADMISSPQPTFRSLRSKKRRVEYQVDTPEYEFDDMEHNPSCYYKSDPNPSSYEEPEPNTSCYPNPSYFEGPEPNPSGYQDAEMNDPYFSSENVSCTSVEGVYDDCSDYHRHPFIKDEVFTQLEQTSI